MFIDKFFFLSLSLWLNSHLGLGRFFSFLILYTVSSLDGGSARRKASIYTQNKRTRTSMPRVGFEPTIPVFEEAKAVNASDGAATVIGRK
jgi:hypothetical protein